MIDKDRFYELAELIVADIEDEIIFQCPQVTQNGKKYFWGLDILALQGDVQAIETLKHTTKQIHKKAQQ